MLCMIAKLDNEATEKLLSLQRIALSAMPAIKPLHGHITIAAYMGENETAFIRFCKELLSSAAPFLIFNGQRLSGSFILLRKTAVECCDFVCCSVHF